MPDETPKTPLEWRSIVIAKRSAYRRGEITLAELNEAADAYIGSMVAHMKARGQRFRAPSRSYVLRAI
jgi:hypothetical protein